MSPSMIALDLAAAFDPVYFSERAGIVPDPWQADLQRSEHQNILVNCSRQSGKSTTVATIAAHRANYHRGSLTLMIAPSERQAKELLRKTKAVFAALGQDAMQAESDTATWLEFPNDSRIIALPGKDGTIRGFSAVDLLLIDEASRVSDDLYRGARPMLAVSGGQLIALSTPFGARGWWHDAWVNGGETWQRFEVPATACPRISPAFLEEERNTIGDWFYQQEYLCRFMQADDSLFSYDLVASAITPDVRPLFETMGAAA